MGPLSVLCNHEVVVVIHPSLRQSIHPGLPGKSGSLVEGAVVD